MRKLLTLVQAIALAGCATYEKPTKQGSVARDDQGSITYYDRNLDGRIDYEFHDFGCCDRNWALVDKSYSGRFDLKIRWGYAVERSVVDLPVPTGVPVTTGPPPYHQM
jgi:hypothetical protein